MPHRFQKPNGEALTADQRAVIAALLAYINQGEYDIKRLNSGIQPFVRMMSEACATDDSRTTMVDELERWVRWNRVPAYWLTFVFQLALNQQLCSHTLTSMRLFADARINLNDDMGLLSLEDALVAAAELQAKSPDQKVIESGVAVAEYIHKIYLLFRNWYSKRPYSTIEPLSEHPYQLRVTLDLIRFFPELRPADTLNPDAWTAVIGACDEDEQYLRVVGRRFAGWAFEKTNHFKEALDQYRLGLSEAVASGLETEICHLARYAASLLRRTGGAEQAEGLLRNALVMESHLELSYWQGLTARELGLALRDKAIASGQTNDAMEAFTEGRQLLDENLVSSYVPVARAVKEQIGRSYSDDAFDMARTASPLALLSEFESAGPRYATDVIVESELARQLPAADALSFRKDRAEFAHHRALFVKDTDDDDSDFVAYMGEVERQHAARNRYLTVRRRLGKELVTGQLSTLIARRIGELQIPGLSFLLFHLAEKRTYAVLLDCATHGVTQRSIEVGMDFWRQCTDTYHANLAAAMDSSMRRTEFLESAVDQMISTNQAALAPLLEPMLPSMCGRHVKIFPRLGLSEVPFHAMRFGGKYLIESADISYAPTLGAFLAVQANAQARAGSSDCPIVTIHDEKRTPAYAATLRALRSADPNRLEVITPATCQSLLTAVSSRQLFDLFFACHGRFDVDDPRNSSLDFDASEQVSFASLFGELELPRCRSVMMGACESGLGRTLVAAEYVGLPLAFLSSGASYVIGTLWQVNRLSAAILVHFYYQHLGDGRMSVVQALNAAQRDAMGLTQDAVVSWVRTWLPEQAADWELQIRKLPQMPFVHPYYWAGFFLTGAA